MNQIYGLIRDQTAEHRRPESEAQKYSMSCRSAPPPTKQATSTDHHSWTLSASHAPTLASRHALLSMSSVFLFIPQLFDDSSVKRVIEQG